MSDFSDKIRQQVEQARIDAQKAEEERSAQMEQKADRETRTKERAKQLLDEIPARMTEAADASEGAMRYRGALMAGIGANAFDLVWEAPPPQRGLRVTVNYFDGVVEWSWLPGGTGGRSIYALDFDMTTLDDLILQLAHQEEWVKKNQ